MLNWPSIGCRTSKSARQLALARSESSFKVITFVVYNVKTKRFMLVEQVIFAICKSYQYQDLFCLFVLQ